MRPSKKIALGLAILACLAAGAILVLGPVSARLWIAGRDPYGLSPARKLQVGVPDWTKRPTPIGKRPGQAPSPSPQSAPVDFVEAISVQRYDPPYDVVKPLWKNPADRKFGAPEEAHFSALSATTREELLKCFTESAQKRLLAADARQGGKLLLSGSEEMPWPPDPFTRYLYRLDLRRGDRHYVLIKVRPVFVKDPPPQDDPNGIYEFVLGK